MEKEDAVRQLGTEAIQRILGQAHPTMGPLAGQVAVEGIGWVRLKDLRDELARRQEAEEN